MSLLLTGHPEVSSTMYHVNVPRFSQGRYDPIAEPENLDRCLADMNERFAERYPFRLDAEAVKARLQAEETITYGAVYDAVMTVLWLDDVKRHWVEKCQLLWREIPEFIESQPNGRAIFVLRDPRSVLASFKNFTYADPPAYLGAVFNCLDAMQRAKAYREGPFAERVRIVRYEDAARNPDATRSELFRFLGVDPDGWRGQGDEWADAYGDPWHANSSFHDNDDGQSFSVDASIRRWEGNLETAEIHLAEAVCGPVMEEFGYRMSGATAEWADVLRLFLFDETMTDHFRRWLFKNEGIQAFPTDPLLKENWQENVEKLKEM